MANVPPEGARKLNALTTSGNFEYANNAEPYLGPS